MPSRKIALDLLEVASPCNADWDSMTGNDRVRFCSHCQSSVNNLSEMTVQQATDLVLRSRGRLCVRFERGTDGKTRTVSPPAAFHQIKRRASRFVAGAFGAALSLSSSVAAQTHSVPNQASVNAVQTAQEPAASRTSAGDGGNASLVGTITDPVGAVVPGAAVTIVCAATGREFSTTSNDEGAYRFEAIAEGAYRLQVDAQKGFTRIVKENVLVQSGAQRTADVGIDVPPVEVRIDVQVEVMGIEVTMGRVAISAPTDLLATAVYQNDLAAVKELIGSGADVNVVDGGLGMTALGRAVSMNNREIMRALLDAGAEVNRRDDTGQTALMRLAGWSTPELLRELLDAGAKVNLKDEEGNTALMKAAKWSDVKVVQALLDAGAKVNAKNKEGRTALMFAAEEGKVETVRALINAGAKPDKKDNEGATALKHARENGHVEVVELLVAYGALDEEKEAESSLP